MIGLSSKLNHQIIIQGGAIMNIIIDRYSGYGKTYLIWDIVKNQMNLDADKIRHMNRNNLFLNECEILCGPIGGKDSLEFLAFNKYGNPVDKTIQNINVFRKYTEDKLYSTDEKESIRGIGFIMLSDNLVKELESSRHTKRQSGDKNEKRAI